MIISFYLTCVVFICTEESLNYRQIWKICQICRVGESPTQIFTWNILNVKNSAWHIGLVRIKCLTMQFMKTIIKSRWNFERVTLLTLIKESLPCLFYMPRCNKEKFSWSNCFLSEYAVVFPWDYELCVIVLIQRLKM